MIEATVSYRNLVRAQDKLYQKAFATKNGSVPKNGVLRQAIVAGSPIGPVKNRREQL